MRGRIRLLIAALCALLFWLVPAADSPDARARLAALRVREWLLQKDGPLLVCVQQGRLAPLTIDLRLSPPDDERHRRTVQECARAAREWAIARQIEGVAVQFDASLPPIPMRIYVGDAGVQAACAAPAGSTPAEATWPHPDRRTLLPALLAIALAVLTGRVIPALLAGALLGSALLMTGAGPVQAVWQGALHLVGETLWTQVLGGLQVWESEAGFQPRVILFLLFLFMAIGVMGRSGGMQGMVLWIARFARGPVSAQLCTWLIGLLIFFDDYTNCLVAGTTMQPLGDRHRVSREKIAYIVDSTAAPVAGLSVFSTWIAYEIEQYRAPLALVTRDDGTPYVAADAFAVFVQTIPYRFYCIFTLAFVAMVILLRRDFGPMLAAERRTRHTGRLHDDGAAPMAGQPLVELQAPPDRPLRARNALLPILVLVGGTLGLIVHFGFAATDYRLPPGLDGWTGTVRHVLANAASQRALMWASLASLLCAALLAIGQRILGVGETVRAALRALRALGPALIVLLLAWCLAEVCAQLGTSYWLCAALPPGTSAGALPIALLLLAAGIAFATGTSYGTMAILLPNVVVLAHTIGSETPFGGPALMVLTIGAVLEGAIFGDHCSPISDTSVLSAMGTRCSLLSHVHTQMPYALVTLAIAVTCGYVPVVLLGPHWWWLSLLLGWSAMAMLLFAIGRDPARKPASG